MSYANKLAKGVNKKTGIDRGTKKAAGDSCCFAERLGFEPRVQSPVRRISSAVHSTTLASLQ